MDIMVQDPKARNFVCFMGTRNPWTGRVVECGRGSDQRRLLEVLILLNFIQIEPGADDDDATEVIYFEQLHHQPIMRWDAYLFSRLR
jgi:hypothetical protein